MNLKEEGVHVAQAVENSNGYPHENDSAISGRRKEAARRGLIVQHNMGCLSRLGKPRAIGNSQASVGDVV